MIQHINENRRANIITIEDPIEFLHRDMNSHINQREVGTDTATFGQALRRVLRQDPGRHPDRRNSRPRDAGHRAEGGRHRAPRVLDAAHDGRDADDQPRAVVLSAAPAGRSAVLAGHRARRRRLAAARAARRQAGAYSGVRGAHQHRRGARQHPRHGEDAQHSGPDQGRHRAVRHAELRPVAHELVLQGRRSRTRARCSTRPTRRSSRCACRASTGPATRGGRGLETAAETVERRSVDAAPVRRHR